MDVCQSQKYTFEIIFVDDGSTDQTREMCKNLKPLKYIRMRKNFGQTAAMDIGIKTAQYMYIITMDGDGQNNPKDIPRLIECLEKGNYDVVSGWRKNRKDSFMKRFVSRGANLLRYLLVHDGIHDSGCSLKIYRRECFSEINLYGEMHRFIPALLEMKGYSVGEVIVDHRPRVSGKTKYNWKITFKFLIDMIALWFWNRYAVRPLHILGGVGIGFLFLGGICGIWSVILFANGYKMSNNIMPPLLTVLFVVIGLMMFIFGLMSDVMSKIYYGIGVDHSYSVKEIIDQKVEDDLI